jgi:hypothetical protein
MNPPPPPCGSPKFDSDEDSPPIQSSASLPALCDKHCYIPAHPRPLRTNREFHSLRIPSAGSSRIAPAIQTFFTYRCTRDKSTTISGRRTFFTFSQKDDRTFSAKFKKQSKLNYIPIVEGATPHISSTDCAAFLLYGNSLSDFSLRQGSRFGDEILSLQFRRSLQADKGPRKLKCFFFHQSFGCPRDLESADPRFEDKAWTVDLGVDECLSSVKNCRLEHNGIPYCYVRKMEADVVEVEAKRVINELHLFAIGIASLLCPV